jgi:hypothetical protein
MRRPHPAGQTGYSQPIPKAGIGGCPRFAARTPIGIFERVPGLQHILLAARRNEWIMIRTEGNGDMTNAQFYLAIGVPILFNGLLFVLGLSMLLAKLKHLEGKLDGGISKVEAKLGIG